MDNNNEPIYDIYHLIEANIITDPFFRPFKSVISSSKLLKNKIYGKKVNNN